MRLLLLSDFYSEEHDHRDFNQVQLKLNRLVQQVSW